MKLYFYVAGKIQKQKMNNEKTKSATVVAFFIQKRTCNI